MRLSRILILLLVCLGASPGLVVAQQPTSTGGRVAGIAPAPTPTPTPPPPADSRARQRPVFFGNVPVVVLADGRVFGDFGHGFEQVVNWCGVPANFDGGQTAQPLVQPTAVQPTVIPPAGGVVQPLPYTPPAPSQPAASQQMVPQATQHAQQVQASRSTLVNTQMCWSNDPRGRVFVGRP